VDVREGRVQQVAIACHAVAQRARERGQRPVADAGPASGVMLVVKMVPNGVRSGRPPAKGAPVAEVWQTMQSPCATTRAPRLMLSGAKSLAGGVAIGAMAGCHIQYAAPNPASTISVAAAMSLFFLHASSRWCSLHCAMRCCGRKLAKRNGG
jgi:hypothetical protein